VSDNRVPRIFGPRREEVAGGWRRLHNEEFHNLDASSDIIRVIKSKRMKRAGHVACMGDKKCIVWSENLKERDHLVKLGVDEKI
jgi:hypothetical protein